MIAYPNINPVAIALGPLEIKWYGIMYLLGFAIAYFLARYRIKNSTLWTKEKLLDFIFYAAWGIIIGGRVGYVIIYKVTSFIDDPLYLFRVWEGGMSFHGGLIGAIIAIWLFKRKLNCSLGYLYDFAAPLAILGIAFGRIGNFINGELWGRVTDVPWGMIFPMADNEIRHPSQIYESFLEGFLLFIIIWIYSQKARPTWAVSGLFLIGYGIARFIVEFFREPDMDLGFVAFNTLTMGQIITIPMILIGLLLMFYAYYKKKYN